MTLTLNDYRQKLLGCWMGKNIGGTLGAPFEGYQKSFDIDFYTHDISGDPLPNDDLDLQLVWLYALEKYGNQVNASILGELWHSYITADWCEYGAGKNNMRIGLNPPLSGYVNNPFRDSNGAWIRSEIWASVAPGHPEIAVQYAYEDGIVDHSHEGVYSEIFCAALQSAAFCKNSTDDMEELIQIGLSYIPTDCGVAKGVAVALEAYHSGLTWLEARKKVLNAVPGSFGVAFQPPIEKDVPIGPLGWDAPGNIGIVVIGLMYGEGDFGKSICIATGCGEDTDCTAGTVGATLGIILGIDNIPEKWINPIGRNIKTMCLNQTDWIFIAPKTIDELTDRILKVTPFILGSKWCDYVNSADGYSIQVQDDLRCPPNRSQNEFRYIQDFSEKLKCSPFGVRDDFIIFNTMLDYGGEPIIQEGKTRKFRLRIENNLGRQQWLNVKWHTPNNIQISPGKNINISLEHYHAGSKGWTEIEFDLTGTDLCKDRYDLLIEITSHGRHTKGFIPVVLLLA
ncbi:MAG: ADP-ribosylglycohydrolase family protein [Defluviitaleaceae bacterium]|nr:ADP-ribosylglycohydrolase family protein [Defluviitaleaceae bacterium]